MQSSLAEREDKWQKWSNLEGQVAKNVLVNVLPNGRTKCQKGGRHSNGRKCGSSDCIFILAVVICDCYMDHGISAIGAETSPVI